MGGLVQKKGGAKKRGVHAAQTPTLYTLLYIPRIHGERPDQTVKMMPSRGARPGCRSEIYRKGKYNVYY